MQDDEEPNAVAVIGGGISGLSAAWLLEQQGKKVTLYESEATLGGCARPRLESTPTHLPPLTRAPPRRHSLTVDTKLVGPVDLGFQVCNFTTYPHLFGFFGALGVDTEPSDMSFALSTPELEWGSRGLEGVFATPGSARSPRFLKMLGEVIRFGNACTEVLDDAETWEGVSLGQYLSTRGYSPFFQTHYILPMCAAIWSCSHDGAMEYPVVPLVRFWKNHVRDGAAAARRVRPRRPARPPARAAARTPPARPPPFPPPVPAGPAPSHSGAPRAARARRGASSRVAPPPTWRPSARRCATRGWVRRWRAYAGWRAAGWR